MKEKLKEHKKVVCYYHSADMDGIASAAIVKKVYPNAKLIGVDYGDDWDVNEIIDSLCIIVDFSFPNMDELKQYPDLLCWIDHHKSAMEKNPELWNSEDIDGLRQMDKSGCRLTWEWFMVHEEIPEAILLIEDYDIWKFKYGDRTKAFGEGAALEIDGPENPKLKVMLSSKKIHNTFVDSMIMTGQTLLGAKDKRVKKAFENGIDVMFHGYKTRMCNSSTDTSNLGNYCCKQGYDIGLIWSVKKDKVICGLRSIGDVDVSIIAKLYGGGGHKNASGFESYLKAINKLMEEQNESK